jgi:hypothetical protein
MFERFTDRAKKVLSLSRTEAIRLGHAFIGPEHMLCGLLAEGTWGRMQRAVQARRGNPEPGRALVLLPPGQQFAAFYQDVIAPALRDAGVSLAVAETGLDDHDAALSRVLENVLRAEVLLAVITGRDPAVLYQLGMFHGLGRHVILLAEHGEQLPRHLRCLEPLRYADADRARQRSTASDERTHSTAI